MNSQDDPFFELRLYRVEPGRIHDMERRMQEDLRVLFPRHGVRPVGTWSVRIGAKAPLFVYLMPWRNMQERTSAFAGFVADPDWAEARGRTNAGTELVERYEILFLRAMRDWQSASAPTGAGKPVTELVLQEVAQGQGAAVRGAIMETALPLWQAAGATVSGVFDIMSGYGLPAVAVVVSWPSIEQQAQASEALRDRLGKLRSATGTPLLQRSDDYLMRPVHVDWE